MIKDVDKLKHEKHPCHLEIASLKRNCFVKTSIKGEFVESGAWHCSDIL